MTYLGFEYDKGFWSFSGDVKITEGGKKGRCIVMQGKGRVCCKIHVKKNTFYVVSFWIKRQGWKEGEYPELKIFGRIILLNNVISYGDWIKVEFLLKSRDKEEDELCLINPGLTHRLYIDEIKVSEFSAKAISPSGKIYTYFPEFKWKLTSDRYVLDAEVEISRTASFEKAFRIGKVKTASIIKAYFPIDCGIWYWRVKIYRDDELITVSKPLKFTICGFFPIGIFGVTLDDIELIKKIGFNSVCITFPEIPKDIKFLLRIPSSFWKRDISKIFKKLSSSKNLLAWYIEDEPELRSIPPSFIWKKSFYIKFFDPYHPTLITLVRENMAKDYAPSADIIMVDPYPIPRRPVTWLSESIDKIKKLFPYKPVWAAIQAFDWSAFPYGDEKRKWGRDPTYHEKRCLTYLAVVHGARGVFYFTFRSKNYFIMKRKKNWEELKRIVKELKEVYPLLISPQVSSLKIDQGIHYVLRHVTEGKLRSGYYLIAVNTLKKRIKAKLKLPQIFSSAREIFKGKEVMLKEGRLVDIFSPYEVRIYFMNLFPSSTNCSNEHSLFIPGHADFAISHSSLSERRAGKNGQSLQT